MSYDLYIISAKCAFNIERQKLLLQKLQTYGQWIYIADSKINARNAAYNYGIGNSNIKEALRQLIKQVVNKDKIANFLQIAIYRIFKKQKKPTIINIKGALIRIIKGIPGFDIEDVEHDYSKQARAINVIMGYGIQKDIMIIAKQAYALEYLNMSELDV